jgi:DNA primase
VSNTYATSSAWKEQMRAASPLEKVVEDLTGQLLRSRGPEVAGLCPLHDDHTASLRVNVEKQVWYCDACGEGGDVFALVMRAGLLAFDRARLTRPPYAREGGVRA